jgi:hypothetical protein
MSQDMADVDFAAIKMNGSNQPVCIAADIENNPVVHFICRRKCGAQFGKVMELSLLHNLKPARQRPFAVRILLRK